MSGANNGEHKELMRAIHEIALQVVVVKDKQQDNHADNKANIRILFDELKNLKESLPCKTHIEKFNHYDNHVEQGNQWRRMVVGLFVTLVISIFGVAVAWGSLKERVEQHEQYSKKAWEHCCVDNNKVSALR